MINTLGISEARDNLPEVISKVNKNMDRVVITVNGKPKAIVLSMEELESLEETAEILSIPGALASIRQGEKEIKEGKVVPFEKVVGKTAQKILSSK